MGKDDQETLMMVRDLLGYFPSNNMETPPVYASTDDPNRLIPEFNEIIPENPNKAYDMYDIIRGIADDGVLLDVAAEYAKSIITCFIRLDGQTVGVIANQPKVEAGCLNVNSSDKAARFIRRCDAFNIPMLTIEDVPGFLPGTDQEWGGIIRHGAKLLYAYCEATVPMDETLAQVVMDLSGRPYFVYQVDLPKKYKLKDFDPGLVQDFFQSVANHAGMNLHINLFYGRDVHHMLEGIFKAFGRALDQATTMDPRIKGVLSTKGKI